MAVKGLILTLTLAALYDAVLNAPAVGAAWRSLLARTLTDGPARWCLLAAAALVPVNWGLETLKWRLLARRVEPLTVGAAARAVLLGLTLGFSTPNRMGDYAARMLLLRPGRRRAEAIGANFLGRYAQLVVTTLAGSAGAGFFLIGYHLAAWPLVGAGIAVGLLAVNAALLAGLFGAGALVRLLTVAPGLPRWARRGLRFGRALGAYSPREIGAVLAWSGARYVVFASQFGLLLAAFGVAVPVGLGALAVAGTFLLKSLVPSLSALTDIGTRELSAVHFFGLLGAPALPVLSASLCLWLLNIAAPSALGLLLVPRLRLLAGRATVGHRPRGRVSKAAAAPAVPAPGQPHLRA